MSVTAKKVITWRTTVKAPTRPTPPKPRLEITNVSLSWPDTAVVGKAYRYSLQFTLQGTIIAVATATVKVYIYLDPTCPGSIKISSPDGEFTVNPGEEKEIFTTVGQAPGVRLICNGYVVFEKAGTYSGKFIIEARSQAYGYTRVEYGLETEKVLKWGVTVTAPTRPTPPPTPPKEEKLLKYALIGGAIATALALGVVFVREVHRHAH